MESPRNSVPTVSIMVRDAHSNRGMTCAKGHGPNGKVMRI